MLPKFVCLCLIKPRTLEVVPEATEAWQGFRSILNFHYISIIQLHFIGPDSMLIFTQHVAKSEDVCTQIVSLISYIRNIDWEQPSQVSETSAIPLSICHLICKFSQKHTLMLPYNQKCMSDLHFLFLEQRP